MPEQPLPYKVSGTRLHVDEVDGQRRYFPGSHMSLLDSAGFPKKEDWLTHLLWRPCASLRTMLLLPSEGGSLTFT